MCRNKFVPKEQAVQLLLWKILVDTISNSEYSIFKIFNNTFIGLFDISSYFIFCCKKIIPTVQVVNLMRNQYLFSKFVMLQRESFFWSFWLERAYSRCLLGAKILRVWFALNLYSNFWKWIWETLKNISIPCKDCIKPSNIYHIYLKNFFKFTSVHNVMVCVPVRKNVKFDNFWNILHNYLIIFTILRLAWRTFIIKI